MARIPRTLAWLYPRTRCPSAHSCFRTKAVARLLLQPTRFECCFNLGPAKAERFNAHEFPGPDLPGHQHAIFEPSAAAGHPTRYTSQGDHSIVAFVDSVDFPVRVRQRLPLCPH